MVANQVNHPLKISRPVGQPGSARVKARERNLDIAPGSAPATGSGRHLSGGPR